MEEEDLREGALPLRPWIAAWAIPYLIEHRDGRKLERYLGMGWSAPEGMIAPERFRALMQEFKEHRARLDRLLDCLGQAVEVMRRW